MAITYKHPAGTLAALNTLAGAAGLISGQIYYISDQSRIAIATSTSAYTTFAKQSEVSGAGGGMAWAPVTATGTGSSQGVTIPESGLSESAILVFVNGVLQIPTTNYTVSGTTVTLTTESSGDEIQIVKPGGASWGSITGTLSAQTDLNTALAAKAPTATPTFSGDVTTSGNLVNITGNSTTAATIRHTGAAGGSLVLENTGGTYGTSRLTLTNENNNNGAVFETTDAGITLVDFIFKTAATNGPKNIRFEQRSGSFLGTTSNSGYEFQIGPPTSPVIVIGSGGLSVTGATKITGALTASNIASGASLSGTNTGDQDLSALAPLASPTFTGTVTLPAVSQMGAFKSNVLYTVRLASDVNFACTATPTVLTASAVGVTSIDFRTVSAGDIILLTKQSSNAQNGVYTVTTAGTASVATVLTRVAELNTYASYTLGLTVSVIEGQYYAGTKWMSYVTSGGVLGTTAILFYKFMLNGDSISPTSITCDTISGFGNCSAPNGGWINTSAGQTFDFGVNNSTVLSISSTGVAVTGNVTGSNLSGTNTGDETSSTILTKLSGASGGGTTNFLRADGTWAAAGGGGTTTNALTINNGGAGAASGATFNGSAAVTLSYNSIGAAPLASPTFTGTPAAPTATAGTNTTQLATTAYTMASTAVVSVALGSGGPVSLTTAQAGAGVLVLTGTLIGACTVSFGTSSTAFFNRAYTVVNNTTGAFTVTLQACALSPSGSVVVAQGTAVTVYTNGAVIGLADSITNQSAFGTVAATGAVTSSGTAGIGYATGAGGTVTQATSRTTGVTLNKLSGAITLFSTTTTAGQVTTFTVTNSTVAATDTVELCQKSGTGVYFLGVTAVAAGSFKISVYTPTAVGSAEAPVLNYNVIKGVAA